MVCLLVSAGVILLIDRWSKAAVRILSSDQSFSCAHVVRIHRVINRNAIYRNEVARFVMVIVWLMALVSTVALRHSGLWFHAQPAEIGVGLALGGAAGNLLDVWRHQSVVDFIDLGWWPVFNLADVGIVVGLLLAFWR